MLKTLLNIPAALAAIADFLKWLWREITAQQADKQHAQNQFDIDADYARAVRMRDEAREQQSASPANTPAIPDGVTGSTGMVPRSPDND